MVRTLALTLLIAVTSLIAHRLLGRRRAAPAPAGAVGWVAVEAIGLGFAFLLVNVALATATVLLVRPLLGVSVTVYGVDDVTLVGASLVQGLVVRLRLLRAPSGPGLLR